MENPTSAEGAQQPPQVSENIDAILEYYRREEASISHPQRMLEHLGRMLGRPAFLALTLVFVTAWIGAHVAGWLDFDEPPYFWLQGIVGLCGLLTATVILIAQNRQVSVEKVHSHLDLQINLLTEQKVSKVIALVEELRRDLPMVSQRHDESSATLQEPADTERMLQALDEKRVGEDGR